MGGSLSRALMGVREVRVELPADLQGLLAGEAAVRRKLGDRLEVMVLSARQAPVEHARLCVADILEAVHRIARDEDDRAGAGGRRPDADRQLIRAPDDEEHLGLAEMYVVRGPPARLLP